LVDKNTVKEYKIIIIACAIVLLLLLAALITYFLFYQGGGDDSTYVDQVPWTAADQTISVQKADSDYLIIDGENVPWPDKLSDIEENYIYGTNASNPDTDGDGMEDGWEAYYGVRNPITGRLTIDPNIPDANQNPDGDGFDEHPVWTEYLSGIPIEHRGNGIFDGGDNLTNIEEYIGGSFTDIFEGLDPNIDQKQIAMRGGFHLAWKNNYDSIPEDDIVKSEYAIYNPLKEGDITTDPSDWDTDHDGMDDGFELHFQLSIAALKEQDVYFQDNKSNSWVKREYNYSLDPLDPRDGDLDFDVRIFDQLDSVEGAETLFWKDGLTNAQEYQNNTDPTKWDTDGDSYYDPVTDMYKRLDDFTEVTVTHDRIFWNADGEKIYVPDSNVDWNHDGLIDNKTNPNSPDTDGDLMPDGWELTFDLKPLNSSDRFLDLDGDGMQNYYEYSYPTYTTRWFTTDPFDPDTDGDGMPDGWEAFNAKMTQSPIDVDYIEEDDADGIMDGIKYFFTVNPMVIDYEDDNDGSWILDEYTGEYIYTHIPDNMTNIEEWRPGYWLDGLKAEEGGTWIPKGQYLMGTNPNDPDTDGDNLTDGNELKTGFYGQLIGDIYFTNPAFTVKYYTNASNSDSDSDSDPDNASRVLDDWEETHGQNREPLDENGWDDDQDGIVDEEGEKLVFSPTNATNPDSDLDGLNDVDELFGMWTGQPIRGDPTSGFGWMRTDPNHKDTDLDHIDDSLELEKMVNSKGAYKPYVTNPLDSDTDDDGLEDGLEWSTDFYPWKDHFTTDNWDENEDGDWMEDHDIFSTVDKTNPRMYDTDSDGLSDGWEYKWGSTNDLALIKSYDNFHGTNLANVWEEGMIIWLVNPLNAGDVLEDPDRDGLTNYEEFQNQTDPLNWDTDGDGMADGWEIGMAFWSYNEDSKRWGWNIDALDPTDWHEDPDHDGMTYALWTDKGGGDWQYITYYWPWCNLYEYQFGLNLDGDKVNEQTTHPNEKDTDSDGMPDGFEFWFSDYICNASKPNNFEDNDTLPAGWELFFNGSLWNKPEVYIAVYDHNWNRSSEDVYGLPGAWKAGAQGNYIGKFNPHQQDSVGMGGTDGDKDPDGDSFNNSIERAAHTDPTDTQSKPGVGGRRSAETPPMEDPQNEPELPPEESQEEEQLELVSQVEVQAELKKLEVQIKTAEITKVEG